MIKVSNGSGSKGVALANTWDEAYKKAKKLSAHRYYDFSNTLRQIMDYNCRVIAHNVIKGKKQHADLLNPKRTNKLIFEEFIPNLKGDYKVLYFYGKYFVLNRLNRDNDFRASGSGKFSYPESLGEIVQVLELAKEAAKEIKTPLMSLDIGSNEDNCFLIEYQCVYFGPYTLQYAPFCYFNKNDKWEKSLGPFDLEEEYVRAISDYLIEQH